MTELRTNLTDAQLDALLDPDEIVTSKGVWRRDGTGDLADKPSNAVLAAAERAHAAIKAGRHSDALIAMRDIR